MATITNLTKNDDDIIVGVVYKGQFAWYVSDQTFWFLDDVRWGDAYAKRGYTQTQEPGAERFGIAVLEETTAGEFLSQISGCRQTTSALRAEVEAVLASRASSIDRTNALIDLVPALLVDFDKRMLLSQYSEPLSFEDFAPAHWQSAYRVFSDEIPLEHRYWMINGSDAFG